MTVAEVYHERDIVVGLAVTLARLAGYPVWIDTSQDTEWPILYIGLPTGQVSWHVHYSEYETYCCTLLGVGEKWDGHSDVEKAFRIAQFTERWRKNKTPHTV